MPPMPEIVDPAVYAEYQEKRRIRQMLVWYPTVAKLAEEGNWEEFILRVSGIYELMPAVFRPGGLCEDAPDDIYTESCWWPATSITATACSRCVPG